MALATIAGTQLTAAMKPQLTLLVDDMRARLDSDPAKLEQWKTTHQEAVRQKRTAGKWTDWAEDQLTQAAVGWLLTSVFVRFCEDNLLLGESAVWISGPTPMLRQRAIDAENDFYRTHQDLSYREWLAQSFEALRANPATAALIDEHAALNIMEPSSDAVQLLLNFWRRTDDSGNLIWSFADNELTTRFLGDLYQDLSDFAKDKYALLQTPDFVENFILDRTLEPALKERPLEGFKIIDPTCGSGHFLLGSFARLVERWHHHAPGLELRTRVDNALASVYGIDLNPFAIAIAKFRLIVAAMLVCNEKSLVHLPKFTLNLAVGDSLLHGPEWGDAKAIDYGDLKYDKDTAVAAATYSTEDAQLLRAFLSPNQYDVVVGNPPYIAVEDKALKQRYKEIYNHCTGRYVLSIPFMERFFVLCKSKDRAGWVGQITSNSFMKREYGISTIEKFLSNKDLRLIVDTSGVYLPGHGTPTLILIARNQSSFGTPVHTVRGIQGEPGKPSDPSKGLVWTSIEKHANKSKHSDAWISVSDLPRKYFDHHPWSLSADAFELIENINSYQLPSVSKFVERIGFFGITGASEAMIVPPNLPQRLGLEHGSFRPLSAGEEVRDYTISSSAEVWFPYTQSHDDMPLDHYPKAARFLWNSRTILGNRATFKKKTYFAEGKSWHLWHQLPRDGHPTVITFAEQATHNHFAIDRNNTAFTQKAPILRLSAGNRSIADHLRLLGPLSSSLACFWLRQHSYCKDGSGESWSQRYEFSGTTVGGFPLPANSPLDRIQFIDTLTRRQIAEEPQASIRRNGATQEANTAARNEYSGIRASLITEQDELDWEVYFQYGLIRENLTLPVGRAPGIELGERAFEIALARRVQSGATETEWFTRHGANPITAILDRWPAEYRDLVQKRLDAIESNPFIQLLERPEYKRRWAADSWDLKLQNALRDWLLDKLEEPKLWFSQQGTPRPRSVLELAGEMERDREFLTALDMWAGQKDAPVTTTLVELLSGETVPYLAALRYKDSGLRKRAEWERMWDLQRKQDAGIVEATDIPVPSQYKAIDFLKPSYWTHRGKLDVPKERFVAYPDVGRATDHTPLLGWAGWDHGYQGLALATIFALRESEGRPLEELIPVLAGIAELLPWVKQWHSGTDPYLDADLAEYLTSQLNEKSSRVGVPVAELKNWRPAAATRGRKAASKVSQPRKVGN